MGSALALSMHSCLDITKAGCSRATVTTTAPSPAIASPDRLPQKVASPGSFHRGLLSLARHLARPSLSPITPSSPSAPAPRPTSPLTPSLSDCRAMSTPSSSLYHQRFDPRLNPGTPGPIALDEANGRPLPPPTPALHPLLSRPVSSRTSRRSKASNLESPPAHANPTRRPRLRRCRGRVCPARGGHSVDHTLRRRDGVPGAVCAACIPRSSRGEGPRLAPNTPGCVGRMSVLRT